MRIEEELQMDFLEFVNSKDIKEYLQEIKYKLTPIEAAWLVYQCRTATIMEKHSAWDELIQSMPDCEIPEREDCCYRSSLHQFLVEYIAFEDELMEQFNNPEGAYYRCYVFDKPNCSEGNWMYGLFSNPEEAMHSIVDMQMNTDGFLIMRETKDQPHDMIGIIYNEETEPLRIDVRLSEYPDEKIDLYLKSFDGMWFDFPTPFKKGDILYNPMQFGEFWYGPFVYLGKNKETLSALEKAQASQNGGNYDMTVEGFFQASGGKIQQESVSNYMDCERYTEELTGVQRVLGILKNYLRGKLEIDQFANTYYYLLEQEKIEKTFGDDFVYEKAMLASMSNRLSKEDFD